MSGAALKVKADDVAALFRKEIQDAVARLKSVCGCDIVVL
jgi:hypothetical protein